MDGSLTDESSMDGSSTDGNQWTEINNITSKVIAP